jgi:flagellar hook assembly protein FlgD
VVTSLIGDPLSAPSNPGNGEARLAITAITPNPGSEPFAFEVRAPAGGEVGVDVYDVRGRLVRRLDRRLASPGAVIVTWDGLTEEEQRAPSGVYFSRAGWVQGSHR